MRVSCFTKYDSRSASTRQRLLQYIPHLNAAGIEVDYRPLLGDDYLRSLASGGNYSRAAVARSYLRRMHTLAAGQTADAIWIYAELFPYLPAWFEALVLRSGKPIVYDFDDAVFQPYDFNPRPLLRRLLGGKLEPLLKGAAACCCGNAYLQEYASRFCENSIILPTVVDTNVYVPNEHSLDEKAKVVIGWIGSPSTWHYVQPLLPMLAELVLSHSVELRIIGAGPQAEADRFPGLHLIDWEESAEVREVQRMDIGIMPLVDHPWARGKSGYKLIQYMACGIPVLASPIGVNAEIVDDGVNGFLPNSVGEWKAALTRLVEEPALRKRMGLVGRQRAEARYSLQVHAPRLVEVFKSL